jgi:HAE1 family hydrophobic/amphiphilic exporter-1
MILSKMAVTRPVLTTVIVAAILVLGLFSYTRLVVDLFPEIDFPFVTVTTIYPGAGPEEVESQISKRIEDAVSTIAGIKRMDSINRESVSLVLIEFKLGVDQDQAAIDVKEKVEQILNELPQNAEKPQVAKFDIRALPILNLALTGPQSLRELYEVADKQVRDAVSQAPGVASVTIVGGRKREIQVALDPAQLVAFGLDASQVIGAIARENVSVPAGRVTEPGQEFSLRVLGEFTDLNELRRLPVQTPDGGVVRISDLGRVVDAAEEARDLAMLDGVSSVGLYVQKRTDANTVETAANVRAQVARLSSLLPAGMEIDIVRDNSTFIRTAVRDVLINIMIGIMLCTALLYLFLHSLRTTVIAAIAMPTSIVATFLLMDFGGFSINIVTLLALGISIGVLVTNAIVVLESISRHVDILGEDPKTAARKGTDEVAIAVAATAMTNVVVFTPIAFMGGIIGMFFYEFGLTVVFATLFSLLVSFTLTPMLAAKLLKPKSEQMARQSAHKRMLQVLETPFLGLAQVWEKGYRGVEDGYRRALGWSVRHRVRTTLIVAVIFFAGLYLFSFVGGEFFPESDNGYLQVILNLPAGTTLDQTHGLLEEVEAIVRREVPEAESILMTVGGENKGVEDGELVVRLAPLSARTRDVFQIMNELRESLAVLPAADIGVQQFSEFGETKSIIVEILGPDLDRITEFATQLRDEMSRIAGIADLEMSAKPGKPEIVFHPDRDNLSDRLLPVAAAGMELRNLYEGEVASVYREKGEEYDIRVRLDERYRHRQQGLRKVMFATADGLVPIEALGRLDRRRGLSEINRKNRQRMVSVSANLSSGTLVEKIEAIQERVEQIGLPQGYRVEYAGDIEMLGESFVEIYKALILAIILTYLVLAAILESFIHPFTIMFTLPLGLVGVSAALVLTGATINIMSLMAMVMLVGIVVNNAILILDLAAQLRREGKDAKTAILEAAPRRFRAITMTTLAIVAGILPQALGGAGANYTVAMAVVTMGGVVAAGTLSLFIIPVVYTWFDRLSRKEKATA